MQLAPMGLSMFQRQSRDRLARWIRPVVQSSCTGADFTCHTHTHTSHILQLHRPHQQTPTSKEQHMQESRAKTFKSLVLQITYYLLQPWKHIQKHQNYTYNLCEKEYPKCIQRISKVYPKNYGKIMSEVKCHPKVSPVSWSLGTWVQMNRLLTCIEVMRARSRLRVITL